MISQSAHSLSLPYLGLEVLYGNGGVPLLIFNLERGRITLRSSHLFSEVVTTERGVLDERARVVHDVHPRLLFYRVLVVESLLPPGKCPRKCFSLPLCKCSSLRYSLEPVATGSAWSSSPVSKSECK